MRVDPIPWTHSSYVFIGAMNIRCTASMSGGIQSVDGRSHSDRTLKIEGHTKGSYQASAFTE